MDPDEIEVEEFGVRNKFLGRHARDAGLRHLVEEDIGRVDIDNHICATKVIYNLMRDTLNHMAIIDAGEDAIHIEVESRDATADGIDTQRIDGRPYFDRAIDFIGRGLETASHLVADILAFELVAMDAGDDANTRAIAIADDKLIDFKFLGDGEVFGYDGFDRRYHNG